MHLDQGEKKVRTKKQVREGKALRREGAAHASEQDGWEPIHRKGEFMGFVREQGRNRKGGER